MPSLILPIVGGRHHPPSLALLNVMPVGQPLEVVPEPDNQFDPNAIAVWLDGRELLIPFPPNDDIESRFQGFGFSSETIFSEYWKLGFIPKEKAKDIILNGPVLGKFCVGSNGGPRVEFEL